MLTHDAQVKQSCPGRAHPPPFLTTHSIRNYTYVYFLRKKITTIDDTFLVSIIDNKMNRESDSPAEQSAETGGERYSDTC